MKGTDPEGHTGPRKPLPDAVQIFEPPVEKAIQEPSSESKEPVASIQPAAGAEESYPQEGFQQEQYQQPQQEVF
jgi:hypothetical protein